MSLRVLGEARTESERAAEWYEGQRSGLGNDFLHELEIAYLQIEEHPHRPLRVHLPNLGQREFHLKMLRRFPYKVVYEVRGEEIVVLAIAHARRKPNYWAGRV